jgi:mannose-1-phosphate guanylyltransferase
MAAPPLKALILVGGFGTRLRPLTLTTSKPLVPFCNEPILVHQIKALASVGVTEVVLAVSYRAEEMAEALTSMEREYKLKITISQESEPLGTAGPLRLAAKHLDDGSGEPFFVFNSDVTCEYPLAELLAFHRAHGREGTIMVTKVDEPSKYGVVVHGADGKIEHFVEKPQTFVGNHINAGLYCLSPSVLRRIELRPMSIEKEVFPVMAGEGQLFAMQLPGYWMDIGQPRDYITGMCLHLASLRRRSPHLLAGAGAGAGSVRGDVLIHASATVSPLAVVGPNAVIGPNCVVEEGARIVRSTLLEGTHVKAHALVSGSIIGWRSTVGRWGRVENGAVFGEDVQLAEEAMVNGALVLPHKAIKDSIYVSGQIIM